MGVSVGEGFTVAEITAGVFVSETILSVGCGVAGGLEEAGGMVGLPVQALINAQRRKVMAVLNLIRWLVMAKSPQILKPVLSLRQIE